MSNIINRKDPLSNRIGIVQFLNICVLSVISLSASASDISFQDHEPSSDELINAFMGSNPAPKVKYRGISLKKNTPKPVEKPMQEEQQSFNQQISANDSANACLAEKQSVAVNITFKPNSSNVSDTDLVKSIAKAMNSSQLSNCYFIIEGHTDAIGNDYYNLWLSQKRAGTVKHFLSQYNVSDDRLVVVGKGEAELVNSKIPDAAENRRVVLKIINFKR